MSIFRTTDKADGKICYVNLDHVRSFMPDEHGGTLICLVGSFNRPAQNVHVRETCDEIVKQIGLWNCGYIMSLDDTKIIYVNVREGCKVCGA